MSASVMSIAHPEQVEGVRVQIVLYGSRRHLRRLRAGLKSAGITASGQVALWQNDAFEPGALGPDDSLAEGTWTWTPSDAGNLGFGRAHNRMAEGAPAGCEFLLLLNPDAIPQLDCLERLLEAARDHPRAALIEAAQFPLEHPKGYDPLTLETNWCSAACLLVRRSAFQELGGFDPAFFLYCEDVDLSWRAWRAGWTCLYLPEARCLHVTEGHDLGKDRSAETFYSHLSQLYLRRKHFGEGPMQEYLGAMRERLSSRFVARVLEELSQMPDSRLPAADNPHIVLTPGESYGPRRW